MTLHALDLLVIIDPSVRKNGSLHGTKQERMVHGLDVTSILQSRLLVQYLNHDHL